jgi:hypothetical protein
VHVLLPSALHKGVHTGTYMFWRNPLRLPLVLRFDRVHLVCLVDFPKVASPQRATRRPSQIEQEKLTNAWINLAAVLSVREIDLR